MKNHKILGIIGVHYPYSLAESFFHDEVVELSKHFSRVIVFLTDIHLISKEKTYFDIPKNVELVELNTLVSMSTKLKPIFRFNLFETLKDLRTRKTTFNFQDKRKALKTSIYYESREVIFRKSLNYYLEENSLKPNNLILYSYWLNEFTLGLSRLKKASSNYTIYSRAHGWDVYEERHNPPFLPYRKEIISSLDGLFPISSHGKNYLTENFNLNIGSRIHVSRLGTSPLKFNSTKTDNTRIEILSVAFLSPVKNIELLIDALSKLNIPFRWTHIGDNEGGYSRNIRKNAFDRIPNSNQNVQFLGTKTKSEIQDYLSEELIDVFINTSISEGIPVSMMEALSAGIPVIGPNIGGISELITSNCGFLLSSKPTISEINEILEKLYNQSSSDRTEMNLAAVRQWEKEFNSSTNYAKFAELLKGKIK